MFSNRQIMLDITLIIIVLSFPGFNFPSKVEAYGINYGQLGDSLPQPSQVLKLLQSISVTKARIYDTNPQILTAFANSPVELIVTIENNALPTLIDPQAALQWVTTHIKPYVPATKIIGISAGNEVFTGGNDIELISQLVNVIKSIQAALVTLGLDNEIKVSSPFSLAIMATTYPPSAGAFQPLLAEILTDFLRLLSSTKSPFWINAYPFFAYKDNPNISLDYVLFNPNSGITDPLNNLHYDNMLYAQVDSVVSAISKLGFEDVEVGVSETGWPSKGEADEIGAGMENAATYNGNLIQRQSANEGTPLRPTATFQVYLFALLNEDLKTGPTSERNYGLFHPDLTPVYHVGPTNPLAVPRMSYDPLTSSSLNMHASERNINAWFAGFLCSFWFQSVFMRR